MRFVQMLLHMFHVLSNERTVMAPYYILIGKKSGQAIFDAKTYRLTRYFHIYPSLRVNDYRNYVQQLQNNDWIVIQDTNQVKVTLKGQELLKDYELPNFSGWKLRGFDTIFFNRLSLVVQVLSNYHQRNVQYEPIQNDWQIQQWVKFYLQKHEYKNENFYTTFQQQLYKLFEDLPISDMHKSICLHRLSGSQLSGLTWNQLSNHLHIPQEDVYVNFLECIHALIFQIQERKETSLFEDFVADFQTETTLTQSSKETLMYVKKGFSIEKISEIRKLKNNTIEDHIVEIAYADPDFFIEPYFLQFNELDIEVVKNSSTKTLKKLKEKLPHYSYFQLRLLLTKAGDSNE